MYTIYKSILNYYNIHYNNYNIYLVDNSRIISKTYYSELKNNIIPNYDYIVYRKINSNDKILMTILENIDSNYDENINSCIECNFTFIYVSIKISNQEYDITNILNNNNNFYYIINSNIFTPSFVNWICIYHLNIKNNFYKDHDNYEIIFIDNNADEIKIISSQYVKLNINDYDIIHI